MTGSWFVGKSFSNFKISKFMGSLDTAQYFDLKLDEWKRTFGFPVNFECLRDSCTIEIVDLEGKTHKMTFQKGGTMKFEKIEGKFRLSWNDNDMI